MGCHSASSPAGREGEGRKWQTELGARKLIGLRVPDVRPSWKIALTAIFWLVAMLVSLAGSPVLIVAVVVGWFVYAVLGVALFLIKVRGTDDLFLFTGAKLFTFEKVIDWWMLPHG
jgi:hypothetical protein